MTNRSTTKKSPHGRGDRKSDGRSQIAWTPPLEISYLYSSSQREISAKRRSTTTRHEGRRINLPYRSPSWRGDCWGSTVLLSLVKEICSVYEIGRSNWKGSCTTKWRWPIAWWDGKDCLREHVAEEGHDGAWWWWKRRRARETEGKREDEECGKKPCQKKRALIYLRVAWSSDIKT